MEYSIVWNHIDIFAGCGGISLGLHNAGWKGIFAVEKSRMAFATLKYNLIERLNHFDWPSWLPVSEHDILDVLRDYKEELSGLRGDVTLVAGGPPCQGFSLAGKREENDERNLLVKSYVEFIELVRPKLLFFENVRGFTVPFGEADNKGQPYSDFVIKSLENLSYSVKPFIVDFSDFGVPQKRKRFILVGSLCGNAEVFGEKLYGSKSAFLAEKGLHERVSLKDAISDLERGHGVVPSESFKSFHEGVYGPSGSAFQCFMRRDVDSNVPDSHRFANHRKNTVERFKYIQENCSKGRDIGEEVKDTFNLKKQVIVPLAGDKPCNTLTTLPDDYIHYSEPRILTVRECARIQTFDDQFKFRKNYTTGGPRRKEQVPRYTQVGNAVPPLFMELAGRVLKEI
ncbi:MAG: DNA cytosine methyltransferase [Dehalococcoidia bacterium]|nr:MAG: DNA cytosine methyltransferase [Dehalococcoidia bacterium]